MFFRVTGLRVDFPPCSHQPVGGAGSLGSDFSGLTAWEDVGVPRVLHERQSPVACLLLPSHALAPASVGGEGLGVLNNSHRLRSSRRPFPYSLVLS